LESYDPCVIGLKHKSDILKFDLPYQLGEIASCLVRIRSQVHLEIPQDGILTTTQEGQNFVAWTIPNVTGDVREQLVVLEQLLSTWHRDLLDIHANPLDRAQLAEQAQIWSDKILVYSGLLTQGSSTSVT
jgi:hypothetical protein